MDTHDLHDILAGDGCDWSTVDIDETDFSHAELIELGLIAPTPSPRYQCRDLYHPGRRDHLSDFHRMRWFASRSYRQAAQLAELDGDTLEASTLHREASAMAMMEEADLLIADIRNCDF